jgi:uncharacterized membrane protein
MLDTLYICVCVFYLSWNSWYIFLSNVITFFSCLHKNLCLINGSILQLFLPLILNFTSDFFSFNYVLFHNLKVTICTFIHSIPVSFKLSKRKIDENLQSLHTLMYGKKSNVRFLQVLCISCIICAIYFVNSDDLSTGPLLEEKHIPVFWFCLDWQSSKFSVWHYIIWNKQ